MGVKIKDKNKAYDRNDEELKPGDIVIIKARYVDLGRTDAGADCRVVIDSTPGGYCPHVMIHGSQCEKVAE